jgi:hypothetical protein
VFCDGCRLDIRHDYIVTDLMTKPERLQVARTYLSTHEGWECTGETDLCPACRPVPGFLREAAQRLRDVAPQITGIMTALADPVAEWLDRAAHEYENMVKAADSVWESLDHPDAVVFVHKHRDLLALKVAGFVLCGKPVHSEEIPPESAVADDTCADGEGNEYPEHAYGTYECRRCGAEPES